jgi:hypothetical protein
MVHDRSAVGCLLFNAERSLQTRAVSPAAAVIVDQPLLVGKERLGEYRGAFVAHGTVHKHDRLSRSAVTDFQFYAVDLGAIQCL